MSSFRSRKEVWRSGTLEPVEKILAESTGGHSSFKSRLVAASTRTSTDDRLAATDPLKFSFLEDAQQSDLGFGRQLTDLVEENCSLSADSK